MVRALDVGVCLDQVTLWVSRLSLLFSRELWIRALGLRLDGRDDGRGLRDWNEGSVANSANSLKTEPSPL